MRQIPRRTVLMYALVASGTVLLIIKWQNIVEFMRPEPTRVQLIGDSIVWRPSNNLYRGGVFVRNGYEFQNSYTNMGSARHFQEVISVFRSALNSRDVIIYNAGLHDARMIVNEDMTFGEYRENLEFALIYLEEHSDALVVFRETTPVGPDDLLRDNETIVRLNGIARAVCAEKGVPYIPVWDIYEEALEGGDYSFLPDNLHLSKAGQEQLLNRIVSALDEMDIRR